MKASGKVCAYHPLNPHPTTWEYVKEILVDELSSLTGKTLKTVPFQDWVQTVRRNMETMASSQTESKDIDLRPLLEVNPAVKLLDFYEQVLGSSQGQVSRFDITKTQALSKRLNALEGLKVE